VTAALPSPSLSSPSHKVPLRILDLFPAQSRPETPPLSHTGELHQRRKGPCRPRDRRHRTWSYCWTPPGRPRPATTFPTTRRRPPLPLGEHQTAPPPLGFKPWLCMSILRRKVLAVRSFFNPTVQNPVYLFAFFSLNRAGCSYLGRLALPARPMIESCPFHFFWERI
jgi:hypothetical protein